jgi:K+-sensing histidine kinase KdpD
MSDQPNDAPIRLSLRAVMTGVLTTLLAAGLARAARDLGPGSGVAIFMLSVTVAAAAGGLWAGATAAILASVILPFLERPGTPVFDNPIDFIASVVFLAIAIVVGLVVGNAADERARATRREREARLLAFLSSKL